MLFELCAPGSRSSVLEKKRPEFQKLGLWWANNELEKEKRTRKANLKISGFSDDMAKKVMNSDLTSDRDEWKKETYCTDHKS